MAQPKKYTYGTHNGGKSPSAPSHFFDNPEEADRARVTMRKWRMSQNLTVVDEAVLEVVYIPLRRVETVVWERFSTAPNID